MDTPHDDDDIEMMSEDPLTPTEEMGGLETILEGDVLDPCVSAQGVGGDTLLVKLDEDAVEGSDAEPDVLKSATFQVVATLARNVLGIVIVAIFWGYYQRKWGNTGLSADNMSSMDKEGHYFVSTMKMKELAQREQNLVDIMVRFRNSVLEGQRLGSTMGMYIFKKYKADLKVVERYLQDYDESIRPMMLKVSASPQLYFTWPVIFKKEQDLNKLQEIVASHPLVSFRLIRRILLNVQEVMKSVKNPDLKSQMKSAFERIIPPVNKLDVQGAVDGIMRIQDTFRIRAYNLTKGQLLDFETNSGLRARDAYVIGRIAFENKNFMKAVEWLSVAYRKITVENDRSIEPPYHRVPRIRLVEAISKHNEQSKDRLSDNLENWLGQPVPYMNEKNLFNFDTTSKNDLNFRSFCGGFSNGIPNKELSCWLKRDNPYLMIKPLKAETLSRDPLIIQFYEWLPKSMIKEYKTFSEKLHRAKTVASESDDSKTGVVHSPGRISTNAWILESGNLSKIQFIVEEAIGLSAVTHDGGEESQLGVYGSIGGFYKFHFDSLFDPRYVKYKVLSPRDTFLGDRIATVMFYLSDVKLGGGTAFPTLGIVTKAVEGSGVFWYNLLKSGEKNENLLHGGCPVLYGEKIVVNKWIRSGAQMFIRPCSRNRTESYSI